MTILPNNSEILYLLSGILNNSEQFEDAIEYFKMYLETHTQNYDFQLFLANCYYMTKRYNEAISVLQKIPDNFSGFSKSALLLAGCFKSLKRYDVAIEILKKSSIKETKTR